MGQFSRHASHLTIIYPFNKITCTDITLHYEAYIKSNLLQTFVNGVSWTFGSVGNFSMAGLFNRYQHNLWMESLWLAKAKENLNVFLASLL